MREYEAKKLFMFLNSCDLLLIINIEQMFCDYFDLPAISTNFQDASMSSTGAKALTCNARY